MTNPTTYYQENITKYQQLSNKYGKLNKQLSILRLLWFFLWMASIWFTTAYNIHTVVITAIAGLAVFVVLIIYHQKILRKKNTFQLFLSLNEKEIKSLRNDFSAFENGEEFIDERHFYSHDLDIFGSYSLFQFLNRCFSSLGKEKLANSLNKGLYKEEAILAQQKAIDELEKSPNWLQQFQVLGQQTQGEKAADIKALSHWGNKTGIFNALIFKIGAIVIPLLSWLMLYLLIQNDISFSVFSFYIIVPLGFSGIYASRINQNHQELSKQTSSLQKWQKLFRLFETSTFNTKAIQELQDTLKTEEETAGKAIKKLSSLAQAFDTRLNLLGWLILNYFFSWDIHGQNGKLSFFCHL
ncbi:MAG: hypothetical protein B7C24_15705 [Bacteroidetes bacterium 4572_77]|nr:MAG: hypothetical protein B7C24_15705 [Bacteroidetes bacterium 4572_77]